MTTIIEALRTFIATYPDLNTGSPLWVDFVGKEPIQYAILPLAGARVVEEYITGDKLMEYPFAFRSVESTADDLERMENNGFFEKFSTWLDTQTLAGILPTLGAKQQAVEISATGWGYLYEQGQSDTGIYQVQCKLVYEQQQ